MIKRSLTAAILAGAFLVTGCGVTYISPEVSQQAAGFEVRVLPMTTDTVLFANSAPFSPRSLPQYFFETSGTAVGTGVGLGALPQPPELPGAGSRGQIALSVPPAVPAGPYQIGIGDVIRLSTGTRPTTSSLIDDTDDGAATVSAFTVQDDGAVSIPGIGRIMIAGDTIDRAEAMIFSRMVDSNIDPIFSLEVAEFNSQRASIGGAVGSPKVLGLDLTELRLNEALTLAGGITAPDSEFAVIRIYRDGKLYQIPLATYLSRADLQGLRLTNGDAVYVDVTYDLDRAQAFYESQIGVIALRSASRSEALSAIQLEINNRSQTLSELRTNFTTRAELGATERDYVYLAGEVANQSRWVMPYGQQATLADVLYDSGGFESETGNPSQIYVIRASKDPTERGAVTAYHLNAANALNLSLATRMTMRPDDIIFIGAQPVTKWNRAILNLLPQILTSATSG